MTNNMLEFKDFLDYFQNVISLKSNGIVKIKIYYKDNALFIESNEANGKAVDYFNCSKNMYDKIVELLLSNFILENKIMVAYKNKNQYTIKSEKFEIAADVTDEMFNDLSKKIFSKQDKHNFEAKKEMSEFEKISSFYADYNMFLKRCLKNDGKNDISLNYNNGIFSIIITNNEQIIFSKKINCSIIKANYLFKIICENIIDSNSIIISSINKITENAKYIKIQTPKFNLSIPYAKNLEKFHIEALNKMNEYNVSFANQKIKSSTR